MKKIFIFLLLIIFLQSSYAVWPFTTQRNQTLHNIQFQLTLSPLTLKIFLDYTKQVRVREPKSYIRR